MNGADNQNAPPPLTEPGGIFEPALDPEAEGEQVAGPIAIPIPPPPFPGAPAPQENLAQQITEAIELRVELAKIILGAKTNAI